MGEGRAAVVLQRAEQWIGVDLVAGRSQEAAAIDHCSSCNHAR